MKFSQNAQAALSEPDTKAVAYEMTPERKERFRQIGNEVMDLIVAKTKGPLVPEGSSHTSPALVLKGGVFRAQAAITEAATEVLPLYHHFDSSGVFAVPCRVFLAHFPSIGINTNCATQNR